MNITVKRKTENYASLFKLKLILNGETIGKIAFNEEKEVKLTEDTATLQIKQFSGKSNKLTVTDGDVVEISKGDSSLWVFLIAFLLSLITSSYAGISWILGLVLSILVLLGLLSLIKVFELKKVNHDTKDNRVQKT